MRTCRLFTPLFVLVAVCLSACGAAPDPSVAAPSSAAASAATSPAPAVPASAPPVSVSTVPVRQQNFVVTLEAIGSATAVSSVDVKAQLTGVITKVHVTEGQFVRAGQPLFTLDARTEEANVAKMRAQMAKDEAALADAKRQLARSRELLAQNFVSQGALDASQAQVDAHSAAVAGDQAALDAARVALSYTRISAPASGRAGSVNVYAGSSVQANQTSLVNLTQLDPMDVVFSLPQRNLSDVLAAAKSKDTVVTARLPDGKQSLQGRLVFVDSAVDAATGTIKVKARFDNKTSGLWPGLFVNVAMSSSTLPDATVLPSAAIIQTTRGSVVYVAKQGRAQLRPVKILASQGEDSAVSGVKPGERVVLDGRQNLRPDAPIVDRSAKAATP